MATQTHIKNVIPLIAALALPTFAQAGQTESVMAPAPQSDCAQGITLSLEALYMRAYQSSGDYESGDWDFGGRASLGYQFNDCLFTKVTYFGYKSDVYEYSESESDGGYTYNEDLELEVSYIDWVVGQHFKPSENFTLSPYVGLRYGTFEENYSESENDFGDTYKYTDREDFSGFGLVIGVDGTRSLGNNFSIYGTAKTSILFGTREDDEKQTTNYEGNEFSDSDEDDILAFVSEVGLGAQYDFAFSNVAANIRLGAEAQWWSGISSDGDENAGLIGFVLGANFRF